MTTPNHKRRRFQYSLRTLLVLVTLCAIPCSWVGVKIQHAHRIREAASAMAGMGGSVGWDTPSYPAWLRNLLGRDFGNNVRSVNLCCAKFVDDRLEHLTVFGQLRELNLSMTKVTDADLRHLERLSQLEHLWLDSTAVTDAGLEHLKGLRELKSLCLDSTRVPGTHRVRQSCKAPPCVRLPGRSPGCYRNRRYRTR
jgi:hypothetical protein